METIDKILMAVPVAIWLGSLGFLEIRMRMANRACQKIPTDGATSEIWKELVGSVGLRHIPLRTIVNDAPVAQLHDSLIEGSSVVVSTGFLRLEPSVVKAALAHEAAHLTCRHARLVRWLMFVIMVTAIMGLGFNCANHDRWWTGLIFCLPQFQFTAYYSNKCELQADARAAAILSNGAAITTEGAEALIAAVMAVETANAPLRPKPVMCHPPEFTRIAQLRVSRIRSLINQPCFNTPPDRAIRWIWQISFVLLALDVAAIVWLALR